MIEVFKYTDNIKETVYSGNLGEYDDGKWAGMNFSDISFSVIFDWDSNDTLYIKPAANDALGISGKTARRLSGSIVNYNNWEISSQIKLNGINIGENGLRIVDKAELNCLFSLANNSAGSRSLSVILATYSGSRLHSLKIASVCAEPEACGNAQILYLFDAKDETSAKLMFWDGLNGMFPLKAAVNFSGDSGINAYYYSADNRLLQIDKANGKSIFFTYDKMGNLLTKSI